MENEFKEVITTQTVVEDLKTLMEIDKWLEANAKLNQKKNKARKELVKMGTLEKKGKNTYDNYKYFTEAQYKDVANKILVEAGLELKPTEVDYYTYQVPGSKTPVGRIVTMKFTLTDMETGFYEESIIRGEGLDRGDKAGYKAYTGAIKYYLANTFMVPTGDDPEKETPDVEGKKGVTFKPNTKKQEQGILNLMAKMKELVIDTHSDFEEIYKYYKVEDSSSMTLNQLEDCVKNLEQKKKKLEMLNQSGQEVE